MKRMFDHCTISTKFEKGTGLILLDVAAGRHKVLLRFSGTVLICCTAILSLVSLFLLGAIVTVYDAVMPGLRRCDFQARGGGDG